MYIVCLVDAHCMYLIMHLLICVYGCKCRHVCNLAGVYRQILECPQATSHDSCLYCHNKEPPVCCCF